MVLLVFVLFTSLPLRADTKILINTSNTLIKKVPITSADFYRSAPDLDLYYLAGWPENLFRAEPQSVNHCRENTVFLQFLASVGYQELKDKEFIDGAFYKRQDSLPELPACLVAAPEYEPDHAKAWLSYEGLLMADYEEGNKVLREHLKKYNGTPFYESKIEFRKPDKILCTWHVSALQPGADVTKDLFYTDLKENRKSIFTYLFEFSERLSKEPLTKAARDFFNRPDIKKEELNSFLDGLEKSNTLLFTCWMQPMFDAGLKQKIYSAPIGTGIQFSCNNGTCRPEYSIRASQRPITNLTN